MLPADWFVGSSFPLAEGGKLEAGPVVRPKNVGSASFFGREGGRGGLVNTGKGKRRKSPADSQVRSKAITPSLILSTGFLFAVAMYVAAGSFLFSGFTSSF